MLSTDLTLAFLSFNQIISRAEADHSSEEWGEFFVYTPENVYTKKVPLAAWMLKKPQRI